MFYLFKGYYTPEEKPLLVEAWEWVKGLLKSLK